MQGTGVALLSWVLIAFIAWRIVRAIRNRNSPTVAVAQADATAESDAKAQSAVIVNVYHVYGNVEEGSPLLPVTTHVLGGETVGTLPLPAGTVAPTAGTGGSGEGVRILAPRASAQ